MSADIDGLSRRKAESRERAAATAALLVKELSEHKLRIACAESCTGGLVSALMTETSGASTVLWGTVVSYSNESKEKLLSVPHSTIERFGAVSGECASAMATGILELGGVDLSIAITGIAGPNGGTADKPVGLVWIAWARTGTAVVKKSFLFSGDRETVRLAAAEHAMRTALELVTDR